MRIRTISLLAIFVVACVSGFSKGKAKDVLPPYVLSARTVSVIIDPDAGTSLEDPLANQIARKDVESALLRWGRLEPLIAGQPADLIIVIRRGSNRLVNETMPDRRQNDRIGGVNSSPDSTQIGGGQGRPDQQTSGLPGLRHPQQPSGPQTEIASPGDSFAVYNGSGSKPLDAPPVWRYLGSDGLHPHDVPAVAEFRKAIAAAEKAAANHP